MDPNLQYPEPVKSIWVFGYGSLVHTPNFAFNQRAVGYIKGYRRVFWQGSTDHRGTPERPGRTVTLTADGHPAAATWGVAFQLAGTPEEQAAALSYLEWREKQYDVRQLVDVHGKDDEVLVRGALVYIASPGNPNYLGPAAVCDIAMQIATSRGPSGPNYEYVFKLAAAMRAMEVPDSELYDLEEMVRHVLEGIEPCPSGPAAGGAVTSVVGALVGTSAVEREKEEQPPDHYDEFRRWHQLGQLGKAHQRDASLLEPEQMNVQGGDPKLQQQQRVSQLSPDQAPAGHRRLSQTQAIYSVETMCGTSVPSSSEPG